MCVPIQMFSNPNQIFITFANKNANDCADINCYVNILKRAQHEKAQKSNLIFVAWIRSFSALPVTWW